MTKPDELASDILERFEIKQALVARRKALGLSQKRLAEIIGVNQPTISNFEHRTNDPYLSTLQRYARGVGLELIISIETKEIDQ